MNNTLSTINAILSRPARLVVIGSALLSIISTWAFASHGLLVSYGDAESHLNIARRVTSGYTSGAAHLGGIWLPMLHIFLIPFTLFEPLYQSALAGSIVGGISFVISCTVLYHLLVQITDKRAALLGVLVFALNPNVLYMQSIAMTEIPYVALLLLSLFFFYHFLQNDQLVFHLVLSAFFSCLATLTRYDGWLLVIIQSCIIICHYLKFSGSYKKMVGLSVLFVTLASVGIVLWLLWDWAIFSDPLYFTHSQYSARTQQQAFLAKKQLPSYGSWWSSTLYYSTTVMNNSGYIVFALFAIGLAWFLSSTSRYRYSVTAVLLSPVLFNILTLYQGQSIILIPDLTPSHYEWHLFNVRYGILLLPAVAVCISYLYHESTKFTRYLLVMLFSIQLILFYPWRQSAISITDSLEGLSKNRVSDAEMWMKENYRGGVVLIDDYTRPLSTLRSSIPIENIIYVGNKPYWEESMEEPEKYADWIVLNENDTLWNAIYLRPQVQGRLFTYFEKVYTSPQVLIFKKPQVNNKYSSL